MRHARFALVPILFLALFVALAGCGGGTPNGAEPSRDASLSVLQISQGMLMPAFDPDTHSYTAGVGDAGSSISVTLATSDAAASVAVDGIAVASGSPSAAIPLAVGANTLTIVATAADGTATTYTVVVTRFASMDLIDPTPGASDQFGSEVVQLGNGNLVVVDHRDSSVVANSGAVHLYSPLSATPIASIYGDVAADLLGRTSGASGVTALPNGNFVIASGFDDEGGIVDAGSVRLVNGTNGVQIGPTLSGDVENDFLGAEGATALPNGNFVVVSVGDDEGGIVDAGSVRLVNGTTGAQIGPTLSGDVAFDRIGSSGITVLPNGDFFVATHRDDVGGIVDAGSVRLVSGTNGAQIGPTLSGDETNDRLGWSGVTALPNGNVVIASTVDDEGGVVNAGSVRLVNGTTLAQIGPTLSGDVADDSIGFPGVTLLPNGDFVVATEIDDEGGIVDAGSVRLMSGTTGTQIGPTLSGDVDFDSVGIEGAIALPNGNFVVASRNDDEGGIVNAGSVRLMSGTTGMQIGPTLSGDVANDRLGVSGVTVLSSGDFVVASREDDEGGIVNAGSVRLLSGTTGALIATLSGDMDFDHLGSPGVTALPNGDFVIASSSDDEGGIGGAGSVRLVNGTTGAQIGPTLSGDVVGDNLGSRGVTALLNGNFVVVSGIDDEGGIVNAGSARLVSGSTGLQLGSPLVGGTNGDMNSSVHVLVSSNGAYYVISSRFWDNTAGVDSGRVRLIAK